MPYMETRYGVNEMSYTVKQIKALDNYKMYLQTFEKRRKISTLEVIVTAFLNWIKK